MNARVLLRRESIIATPNPSMSLSLLRDEQRVRLEELLMVDNSNFKLSMKHEKGLKSNHHIDIGGTLAEFHKFW